MGRRCRLIFLVSIINYFDNVVEIVLIFKILTSLLYILDTDLMSKVAFKYEVLQHFINFDETHLTKSSQGDKSGL